MPVRWRSRKLLARPSPVLLEPVMAVEVVTPEDYAGRDHGRPEFVTRTD